MTEEKKLKIEDLIHRHFPRSRGMKLKPEMDLRTDLFGHDLDVIQLVMDLEDHLDVEITDEEDADLQTVGDVVKLVDGKLQAAG